MSQTHDPLRPHTHDPNPDPPSDDPTFALSWPEGSTYNINLAELQLLPKTVIKDCYIVSTGHGTSGPFAFGGALLVDLLREYQPEGVTYAQIEVISGDGFGNRIMASELEREPGQFLLAYERDGLPLSRADGLVRLIVPSEVDDALRQVKWVGRINVLP